MKKYALIGSIVTAAMLTGCASTQQMSNLNLNTLKQSNPTSIVTSKRQAPDFLAVTALNVQFGLLGVASQASTGNKVIKENNVEDPAIYIANTLATELAQAIDINTIKAGTTSTKSGKTADLAAQYKEGDLLIDVQTIGWQSIYYTSDWNNYRVLYTGKFRLIDTKNKVLLAESTCTQKEDDKANSPSYDELFANNAAVLKASLKAHADTCIAEFKAKALNLAVK